MRDTDKEKELNALREEVEQMKKDIAKLYEFIEKLAAIVRP